MSSYGLDSSHTGLGPAKGTCSLTCVVSRDLVSRRGPGEVVRWRWRRYLFILRQSPIEVSGWEARLGRMPRYPNAFTRTRSLCPISPPPPRVPRPALPKAFTGICSPCSPCTLRTSVMTWQSEQLTQPSPARLALPSSHAAPNSGRGGGSLACSGASAADCWPSWPALSEARGATAEVGHTVGVRSLRPERTYFVSIETSRVFVFEGRVLNVCFMLLYLLHVTCAYRILYVV